MPAARSALQGLFTHQAKFSRRVFGAQRSQQSLISGQIALLAEKALVRARFSVIRGRQAGAKAMGISASRSRV